ncbi:hypothetical protein F8388_015795 [Cannabis sativa]|uniref:Uncharacterized protein n=1 Tax=Cannabis sativa TaxID=3483 RepID=A0A7J6FGD5_CANSA|nr:hypothetical protein F8388_015795 [Cannabis sativa]
MAHLLLSICVI